jgi:pSer/pThr/pTyr-binding forkhead associated (FHA) protein
MGIFRRIESGLERAFEGGFGRTFKSHVQAAEIARKLRKEMDDHRTISVSQVYVPNIYTVYLAPADREQFLTREASLRTELATYLTEYATRQVYTLPGKVRVVIEAADELAIGTFGIAVATEEEPRLPDADGMPPHSERARLAPDESPPLPPEFAEEALKPVEFEPAAALAAAAPLPPLADEQAASETALVSAREAVASDLAREPFALRWEGGVVPIDRRALVIGRSRECDVVLEDRNVSRRHAELVREGDGFTLRDLDSTNGCSVNGRRVRSAPVGPGDTITVGSTALTVERIRS